MAYFFILFYFNEQFILRNIKNIFIWSRCIYINAYLVWISSLIIFSSFIIAMGNASTNEISFEASNIPDKSLKEYLFTFIFFPIILAMI